jgi:hypothetical protein
MKALELIPTDGLRDQLRGSLFHCFLREGYSREESGKLVDIAVSSALDLAHAVYKAYVEAAIWPDGSVTEEKAE